ncbi:hypothetical protein P7K49_018507, partial [Saguinus oedipus]
SLHDTKGEAPVPSGDTQQLTLSGGYICRVTAPYKQRTARQNLTQSLGPRVPNADCAEACGHSHDTRWQLLGIWALDERDHGGHKRTGTVWLGVTLHTPTGS